MLIVGEEEEGSRRWWRRWKGKSTEEVGMAVRRACLVIMWPGGSPLTSRGCHL